MKKKPHLQKIIQSMQIVSALLTAILLSLSLYAQSQSQLVQNRFLLIFDTSATMQECLPDTQTAVQKLFFSMMNDQLYPGDSIGVWTFAQKAETGKFPLQQWNPAYAATIASNINAYVQNRRYRKSTDFDETMSLLDDVVHNSGRLTVLIFCDGDGKISHTPFDDVINRVFEKDRQAMQQAHQPFVIVLRSQEGRYIGYTVNSAAGPVNFPGFPPLPQAPVVKPPSPPPAPPPPPPAPVVYAPPLIIIGTNVGTNLPAATPPVPKSEPTNSQSSIVPTNQATEASNTAPTTASVETSSVAPTNGVAPPPENSGISSGGALKIGLAFLAGAVVLVILMIRRAGKSGKSLISSTMDDKK